MGKPFELGASGDEGAGEDEIEDKDEHDEVNIAAKWAVDQADIALIPTCHNSRTIQQR